MSKRPPLPPLPEALLVYLEHAFPDTCPPITASDAEVRIKMGEVNVVRHLRHEYEKQNKTTFQGT